MARYCFYCNKELKPGERCTCRASVEARTKAAAARQAQSGSAADAAGAAARQAAGAKVKPEQAGRQARREQRTRAKAERVHQKQAQAQARRRSKQERVHAWQRHSYANAYDTGGPEYSQGRQRKSSAGSGTASAYDRFQQYVKTAGRAGSFISDYITHPTQGIQKLGHSRLRVSVVVLAIQLLLMGLLTAALISFSSLGRFLLYSSLANGETVPLTWVAEYMIQAVFLGLAGFGIKWLLTHVVFRISQVAQLNWRESFQLLTPGLVYTLPFLLLALCFTNGSGLQALALAGAGLAFSATADFLSFRLNLNLSSDQSLRYMAIILVLLSIFMGMVLSLFLPSLSEFAVNSTSAL